ncbi:MAG: hypothetical protein V3R33_05935 [Anaerolineales bacterium]
MMAIEPTSVQRNRMLAQGKSKLTLVQFLFEKDSSPIEDYLGQTQDATLAEGGSRDHQLKIDQLLSGGEMPYHYLIVDSYPSSQALLQAHEQTREIRQDSINEIYGLIVRPNPAIKRIAKGLGFLSSLLTKLLFTSEIKEINNIQDLSDRFGPDTDPDAWKVSEFNTGKLDDPFYMMNLNQFSPPPKRGVGGKAAYNQYSSRVTPYLISVGGYPDIYGKILSTYIGDQKSQLSNGWHDFALVYYPSRISFLRLMTNIPGGAAEIRRADLKRVVLIPCSTFQDHT